MGNLSGKAVIAGHNAALSNWADLVLNPDGNVGIGTYTPDQKLHIVGTTRISTLAGTGSRMVVADGNGDLSTQAVPVSSPWAVSGANISRVSGNVSIRTTSNIFPLHVGGNTLRDIGSHGFFNKFGGAGTATTFRNISIFADNFIAAQEFVAFSDARIKNIKGRSDSEQDLQTLMQIAITDYTFIDTISKSNISHKKVIAQELKEVYPQAVLDNITEVVPDIYQLADIKNGFSYAGYQLTSWRKGKAHLQRKPKKVSEELRSNSCRRCFYGEDSTVTGEVFVYGREVDDFHSVDYEAISMLNVSATQQLFEQLRMTNDELRMAGSRLNEAETKLLKVDALEAENAELKATLEKLSMMNDELRMSDTELKATLSNLLKRMEKMEQAAE